MVKNKIPDRWRDYKPLGDCVQGTQIIAFKVPLKEDICKRHLDEKDWFTPSILIQTKPGLKTVIDLTNTHRYYDYKEEFGTKGIDHVKIMVEGRKLPNDSQLRKFFEAVDDHLKKYPNDQNALIGVHCTHGLNRTGYFICRWMVDRMNIHPDDAINKFEAARGYKIERQYLVNDLKKGIGSSTIVPQHTEVNVRRDHYVSPLDDAYSELDSPYEMNRYGRSRNYPRRSVQENWRSDPRNLPACKGSSSFRNFSKKKKR